MPFPQNKQDREVRRYYSWMVLWIMIALAILTWIFGFTYGGEAAGPGGTKRLFVTDRGVPVNTPAAERFGQLND